MDLMVGSVDAKRLRRDLIRQLRSISNQKSPNVRNKIYTAEMADELHAVADAEHRDGR